MPGQRLLDWTLRIEAAGFVLLCVVIWMNEYWDLPRLLFGAPAGPPRLHEAVTETVVVAAFGAAVVWATARAFARLVYAQALVTMCARCTSVALDGTWMRFEVFLRRRDRLDSSHGLCPACFASESARLDAEETAS
jgi:hypothetical protein